MSDQGHPAAWYADPMGRHEKRYYDGAKWTEHVASHGKQSIDPPVPNQPVVGSQSAAKVQAQVQSKGVQAAWTGNGHLLGEPVLVVNQKAKLIEINSEFAIYNGAGVQLGSVRQVGQSAAKKAIRVLTSLDQFLTHKFQIVDASGVVLMAVTRPAKIMKSTVIIENAVGQEIGRVVQRNMVGKIRFGLEANGQEIGSINGENWRAWNFNILDSTGQEIARITKSWAGLAAGMFTAADNYVVQIHQPLADPLRSLVVAAATSVDSALKQDARGFN